MKLSVYAQFRYLKLEQQLSAGVAAAGTIFNPARAVEQELLPMEADVMPSLPEAMALVAGAEEDKEVKLSQPCNLIVPRHG